MRTCLDSRGDEGVTTAWTTGGPIKAENRERNDSDFGQ